MPLVVKSCLFHIISTTGGQLSTAIKFNFSSKIFTDLLPQSCLLHFFLLYVVIFLAPRSQGPLAELVDTKIRHVNSYEPCYLHRSSTIFESSLASQELVESFIM